MSNVLTVVTARGHSRELPRKNILPLLGKPLIAWTIECARQAQSVDTLIISSDDSEIISVAESYGCQAPFVRPAELATDEASSIDVILHALDVMKGSFEYVILLQPTSPLRLPQDIDACMALCRDGGADSAVSVCAAGKPLHWMFEIGTSGEMSRVLELPDFGGPRQQHVQPFVLNGAVYVARVEWLRKNRSFVGPHTRAHVMPRERSIDIDSKADFLVAEALLRLQRGA
ncbi:MAG TPA: acylneuraminate cytidylyltransferase family protein [Magnetospirillum sp.]|nr:acylneuraminate cytidylyltransferase family protein [Magnetospirillum sp.]